MKKKCISILLAAVLSVSMVLPVHAAGRFSDVPAESWAYPAIEEMAQQGIVSGVGGGKFDPNSYVTTAQFISMLVRMFYGEELAADDAQYSVWYGQVLQWALDNGLLYRMEIGETGRGGAKWDKNIANGPIYREEMAVLLYNFLKQHVALPSEQTLRTKTAAAIPDLGNNDATVFEQFAIASVYELGCISGIDARGTFDGDALMTRAQACMVLYRVQQAVGSADHSTVGADWVKALEKGRITKILKEETIGKDFLVKYQKGMLADGTAITENGVKNRIDELRRVYPHGMSCTDDNFFYVNPVTGNETGNSGCYALAMYVFDHVFGYGAFYKAKGTVLTAGNYHDMKPGDHIRIEELPHSFVVLEVHDDHVVVLEGNFNDIVYWDNTVTKEELLSYGEAVFYTAY